MSTKEQTTEEIFQKCQVIFKQKAKYKKFKNGNGRIYKIRTVGSYEALPIKLEYMKFTETLNVYGVDSMNIEKLYESYDIVILDGNTNFRLDQKGIE